jgi:hypothetical protein
MLKNWLITAIALLLLNTQGQTQTLKLSQLISFIKKDYTDINDHLLNLGWEIHKPNDKIIDYGVTWLLGKADYDGQVGAKAFLKVFFSSDVHKKNYEMIYQFSGINTYNGFKAEVTSYKMKKIKSGIDSYGRIYSDYEGENYVVRLSTPPSNTGYLCNLYVKNYYYSFVFNKAQ